MNNLVDGLCGNFFPSVADGSSAAVSFATREKRRSTAAVKNVSALLRVQEPPGLECAIIPGAFCVPVGEPGVET